MKPIITGPRISAGRIARSVGHREQQAEHERPRGVDHEGAPREARRRSGR